MNPVRLLAVTESLVESKDTAGRYRLPKQSLLPRFGSPKNPFAERAAEKTVSHPVAPAGTATPAAPSSPPAPRSAVGVTARFAAATQAISAGIGRWRQLLERRLEMTRRLSIPWRRPEAPKPVSWRKPGLPVQTELSLENVRVVRNDLRESDLEVVPLRSSAPRKVVEPVSYRATKPEPAEVLGRWAARFRRVGQAPVH